METLDIETALYFRTQSANLFVGNPKSIEADRREEN